MTDNMPNDVEHTLSGRREALALALVETARTVPRFARELDEGEVSPADFATRETASLVDYIAKFFGEEGEVFRALYLGERAKAAYDPEHDGAARANAMQSLIERDRAILAEALSDTPSVATAVSDALVDMAALFAEAPRRELAVLMVGDCLFLDIVAFLTGLLAAKGIALVPHFVTDKQPERAVASIQRLRENAYDAVFYSPFSYDACAPFQEAMQSTAIYWPSSQLDDAVDHMMEGAGTVAQALAETFAAPIYLHNTAAVLRREEAMSLKAKLRQAIGQGRRAKLRRRIDRRVSTLIDELNGATFPHVLKFDETRYLETYTEAELGAFFHRSPLQHPAKLGAVIAPDYAAILEAIADLSTKKLILCDLDNTLWDGVIGEGAVSHFTDRQTQLLRLRRKGVLLATLSKNDPANVHFTDGTLGADDFVAHEISWSPKVMAIPKLEAALNLKRKDFVFLDDRADERALMAEAHPEIVSFDPNEADTWALLGHWDHLRGEGEGPDRTQMYHERTAREAFTSQEIEAVDQMALLSSLDLAITIRRAEKGDLARATELVNRTNQFNMRGSRTNFAQMSEWQASSRRRIYLAEMRDRFGDMGVVSVLVADFEGEAAEIAIFVLSCRVFGYGAEIALLNQVKRDAQAAGKAAVTGRYEATMVNMPCRDTYAENGFTEEDGEWRCAPLEGIGDDPAWLSVTTR